MSARLKLMMAEMISRQQASSRSMGDVCAASVRHSCVQLPSDLRASHHRS